MSRRKSSVLLPFNATRTGNHSLFAENASHIRNKKTPGKRRRTQVELENPDIDGDGLEVCEDMKGKMWSIYHVGDLNNFNYKNPHTFPRYGRILSRYLVESFTQPVTLKASFWVKPDIQGFEAEHPPVYIKVEDVQLSQPKLVYEGVLLSAYNTGGTRLEGSVHLPVLLARGHKPVKEKVHECLAAVFSSTIHEISFPKDDMLWMIAAWSGLINETKTSKEVYFLYAIPSTNDTVKCQYSVNFIKNFWNRIHDKDNRIVMLKEVQKFHASLVRHTQQIMGVNLAAIPLVVYKSPDFELHATGKVKVKNVEFIPRILRFINDMCETRRYSLF